MAALGTRLQSIVPDVVHTGMYGKEAEAICRLAFVCGTVETAKEWYKRAAAKNIDAGLDLFTRFELELIPYGSAANILDIRAPMTGDTIVEGCMTYLHGVNRIYLDERNEVCFLVDYRWNDGAKADDEVFDDSGSLEKLLATFKYIKRRLLNVDTPLCEQWKIITTRKATIDVGLETGTEGFVFTLTEDINADKVWITKKDLEDICDGFEKILAKEAPDPTSRIFKPETNPIAIEANRLISGETKKAFEDLAVECGDKAAEMTRTISKQLSELKQTLRDYMKDRKLRL